MLTFSQIYRRFFIYKNIRKLKFLLFSFFLTFLPSLLQGQRQIVGGERVCLGRVGEWHWSTAPLCQALGLGLTFEVGGRGSPQGFIRMMCAKGSKGQERWVWQLKPSVSLSFSICKMVIVILPTSKLKIEWLGWITYSELETSYMVIKWWQWWQGRCLQLWLFNPLYNQYIYFISSVQFSRSVVSDSLRPHGLQHAKPPCPSPAPGDYSNSCPLSWWCHPNTSSSVVPFSFHLQSFPASGSFEINASGGQSIEASASASASVRPMNIQNFL